MIEYGNFFAKEDVTTTDWNYLGEAVVKAKEIDDIDKSLFLVSYAVNTLLSEAIDRDEAKIGIMPLGNVDVIYAVFDYNGRIYYWWELYKHNASDAKNRISTMSLRSILWEWKEGRLFPRKDLLKSTLEFKFRDNPVVTYVWFSTDFNQSPLMCTGDFKNIRI